MHIESMNVISHNNNEQNGLLHSGHIIKIASQPVFALTS